MSADDESLTAWPSDPAERGRAMAAAGVIGGRRPGAGRPRRDRFSRLLAEQMSEHTDEVVAALRAGLADSNVRTRVMAARAAVDLAVRHGGVAQRDDHHEEDRFALMTADEVRAAFARELAGMVQAGELTMGDLSTALGADVVDAEVVD
jgi:hypothetical protein